MRKGGKKEGRRNERGTGRRGEWKEKQRKKKKRGGKDVDWWSRGECTYQECTVTLAYWL